MRTVESRKVLDNGLRRIAVVVFCAIAADAYAQLPRPNVVPRGPLRIVGQQSTALPEDDPAENIFLPPDRRLLQQLADARRLIAESRFGEAVRYLGSILESREDFFFQPDRSSPTYRSLRAEAQSLIGQMPRPGRESYELQYGAQAKRMLDDALTAGDMAAVADVSRQFFHTRAGYHATFLLGLHHFDHARPLAGAQVLQRLREAGPYTDELEPGLSLTTAACWFQADMADKAKQCLVSLRAQQPGLRVAVAGREVPIFTDDANATEWLAGIIGSQTPVKGVELDHWLMVGGNAARNASTAGGIPLLNMRWRVTVTDDPLVEYDLQQYQRLCVEQDVPIVPAMHPLAVADVLLMRTSRNLLAVDLATGKRLWEVPEEPHSDAVPAAQIGDPQSQRSMLSAGLRQRMWSDMTFGTLSSDGRLVFAVEDLELELGFGDTGTIFLRAAPMGNPAIGVVAGDQASPVNRLAAYDIRTGKLKWQIGGVEGPRALPQADTYFLGPPLTLFGQLYVLGEIKGEIRLMALEAATGSVLWSQQLAVAEQSVAQDVWRRTAGASPSYADGVLVCPTAAGAIVGVELATRSLLWGNRYGRSRNAGRINAWMSGTPAPARWVDSNVSIVDGRVIATPIESDVMYCFNLLDGKILWQAPRQTDLYVACADRDKVVLVGHHAIRALRMADGKPAWNGRSVQLPKKSMPSGRGFLAGQRYFLPLNSAEVAAIDVEGGKIVQLANSRKGIVAGNLVCYQGKIISQGFLGVDAYLQRDAVVAEVQRRLAAKPDDSEALSLQGEVLLDEGKRSEAIASLRRAYASAPEPRTRELLRDSLMEGLQADFAAYRDRAGEIQRLLDDPAQQAAYLRLMAEGLRTSRQWVDAFDYYQKLIDLAPHQRPLDKISDTHAVRRDRWLVGQLALLRGEADQEAAAKIDVAIDRQLKAAIAAGSIEQLQRTLDHFGGQPAATVAQKELVARLRRARRLLEAEIAATIAGIASEQPSSNLPAADTARHQTTEEAASWPVGQIEVTRPPTRNVTPFPRYLIEMRGTAMPYLGDLSIHFDDNGRTLVGGDGWGRELWRIALPTDPKRPNVGYNRALTHARVQGHLLLVALGSRIVAIDTLGAGADAKPRLLWTQEVTRSGAESDDVNSFPPAFGNLPWQWQQQFAQSGGRHSPLGPVTSRYVCVQQSRALAAIDLYSGETLWSREDLSPGSEVFGDNEYLFVVAPDREEASVLRAVDGQRLGTRKLPRLRGQQAHSSGQRRTSYGRLETTCLATLGHRLLLWWPEGDQRVLTLVDPLEGRDLWPERRFSDAARSCVVGEEAVGVMESDGRFLLLSLPDGRTIADVKLESEPGLADITILSFEGQYFLITRTMPTTGNSLTVQPLSGAGYTPIYRGKMYAFDEQGHLQWRRPAVIQNQFLLRDQPKQLPIVTFAAQRFQRNAMGGGALKSYVLCIDKRNGRTAYKSELTNSSGTLDVLGDREKKTIDLVMQRKSTIRLTFTDKPVPPGAETEAVTPQTPGGEAAQALWDSMRNILGPLIGEPDDDGSE